MDVNGALALITAGLTWFAGLSAPARHIAASRPPPRVTGLAEEVVGESPKPNISSADEERRLKLVKTSGNILRSELDHLRYAGYALGNQGVWIERIVSQKGQSRRQVLASHNGRFAFPGASLSKLATTLGILHKYDSRHRFRLEFYVERDSVGDTDNLIVRSEGHPLLLPEDVDRIGAGLKARGLHRLSGQVLTNGPLSYSFVYPGDVATTSFVERLRFQYPDLTPQKFGSFDDRALFVQTPLFTYEGSPIEHWLKVMNSYSNNLIAEVAADFLMGGATNLEHVVERAAGIADGELSLLNGSGLPVDEDFNPNNGLVGDNLVSPKAACDMVVAIHRAAGVQGRGAAVYLPVVRRDEGTLLYRGLPSGSVGKTGTIDGVTALATLVPGDTPNEWYCVAMINLSFNYTHSRAWQDNLVRRIKAQA